MWLAVVFALVCGCGRIGFEPVSDGAAASDDAAGDGGFIDTPCWAAWRTGAPVLSPAARVAGLNASGPDDKDLAFGADELEVFFASTRPGGPGMRDIWRATRADRSSPFVIDGPVNSVSSVADEGAFRLFPGGVRAVFASRRSGGFDVFLALRGSPTSSVFTLELDRSDIATINSPDEDHDPLPADGGRALYFTRSTATAGTDIFLAQRATTAGPFGPAVLVTSLNGANDEADPMLSPDGLVMVMTSQRTDPERDMFVATRATTADPFSTPGFLSGVNTTSAEHDPVLSADGCELWFASNRGGDFDIYLSTVTL